MLNARGGIECDLNIVRAARDEFYIVTGTGFATHDFNWISRNIPDGINCRLFDITSSNAVRFLMGPRARDILEEVTSTDISGNAFPFGSIQTIGIAGCPVLALRVPYVGESGWELHLADRMRYNGLCAPDIVLLGRETIYRNGVRAGWFSSAGFWYTVDKSIGYGSIRNPDGVTHDFIMNATYELEVATKRIPCIVHMTPLYDAKMGRIKS